MADPETEKIVQFFQTVEADGGWLFAGINNVRVGEFVAPTDRTRHGCAGVLLCPNRPNAEPHMDHLSNLATIGQIGRALEANMLPLPPGVASIAWQASFVPDNIDPENRVLLHVIAMHRYTPLVQVN